MSDSDDKKPKVFSARDLEVIKHNARYNPVCIYLRNKENLQFNVGDILIRQYVNYDDKVEVDKLNSGAPRKYLYAFEDDCGMGYVKMFKADNKLSEVAVPLTEFNLDRDKFILDPEYADHIMIGDGDFNPIETQNEVKKFRNRAIARNRKLVMPLKELKDVLDMFKTMKVGDTFNRGYTVPDMCESKYEVIAINLNTKVADVKNQWEIDNVIRKFNLTKKDSWPLLSVKTVEHSYSHYTGNVNEVDANWFMEYCFTNKDIFPLTDKLGK